MDEPTLTEKIVERLAAGDHVEDIAFEISDQMGKSYPAVEALVKHVQVEHASRIVRKQSPLLILLALTTFLGGMAAIGAGVFYIINFINYYNPGGDDPIMFTAFLFLLLQSAPQGLYLCGGGILAVLGSVMGMQKVWVAILDHLVPEKN